MLSRLPTCPNHPTEASHAEKLRNFLEHVTAARIDKDPADRTGKGNIADIHKEQQTKAQPFTKLRGAHEILHNEIRKHDPARRTNAVLEPPNQQKAYPIGQPYNPINNSPYSTYKLAQTITELLIREKIQPGEGPPRVILSSLAEQTVPTSLSCTIFIDAKKQEDRPAVTFSLFFSIIVEPQSS